MFVSKDSIVECILNPTTILGFLINSTILSKNDDLKALNHYISTEIQEWRFFPYFLFNKHISTQSIQWCRLVKQENIFKLFNSELNFIDSSKLSSAENSKDQQSPRTSGISDISQDVQVIAHKKVLSRKPSKQVQSKLSLSPKCNEDLINVSL